MKCLLVLAALALPVQAEVILTVKAPEGRIDLMSEQGRCLGDSHEALFTDAHSGNLVPGCWIPLSADLVQVAFLDGDIAKIPTKDMKAPTRL